MLRALDASATGVLTTQQLQIALITWVGNPGTAGDSLVIVDNNSKVIWRAIAPAANYNLSFSLIGQAMVARGLNITTLGSGFVDIYIV